MKPKTCLICILHVKYVESNIETDPNIKHWIIAFLDDTLKLDMAIVSINNHQIPNYICIFGGDVGDVGDE